MSGTATMNGKPQRKQLSDQLDRLDGIIDALAEALPAAVADSCKEGARAAVKDAIIEIISNPELRALLAPMRPEPTPVIVTPPEPPKPSLWGRLKAKIAAARDMLTGAAGKVKAAVTSRYKAASDTVVAVGRATGETLPVRRVLLVGLGIGLVVGLACLVMPQTAAAAVGAVSATLTAVAVQTGNWLKRAARRFGLVS
jgi:hypothetical protein